MAEPDIPNEAEAFGITDRLVADVMAAVGEENGPLVSGLLDPLHPADVAHLLEQIDARDRRDLLTVWPGGREGDVLSEIMT